MPLPTLTSVPKRIEGVDSDEQNGASCILGCTLYSWIAQGARKRFSELRCRDLMAPGSEETFVLRTAPNTFVPTALVAHPSRRLVIAFSSRSAFLLNLETESDPPCERLCEELLTSNKRLRLLSIKWLPLIDDRPEDLISEMFAVLGSDNRCRIMSCDSLDCVINIVDLADPDDCFDADGFGLLSDIAFDRAICIDFGKPITRIATHDDLLRKSVSTRIPLFILKSSGEVFCVMFSSSIDGPYHLFGPIEIVSNKLTADFAGYWPCDFLCLHNDMPILAITYKGPRGPVISHSIIFIEEVEGRASTMSGIVYEIVDFDVASSAELDICRDPCFSDRYFVSSETDVIIIDLQWSWLLSNAVSEGMFGYAINHGALEASSDYRKVFTLCSDASNSPVRERIRKVLIAHGPGKSCQSSRNSEQTVVVATDRQMLAFGTRTNALTARLLRPDRSSDVDDDVTCVTDAIGPVSLRIHQAEEMLKSIQKTSMPFSVDGNMKNAKKLFQDRLKCHLALTELLETIRSLQLESISGMITMVEDEIISQLESIAANQKRIVGRLQAEKVEHSNLQQRLCQLSALVNRSSNELSSSECRINEWSDKALKRCHNDLYPKLSQLKLDIDVANSAPST